MATQSNKRRGPAPVELNETPPVVTPAQGANDGLDTDDGDPLEGLRAGMGTRRSMFLTSAVAADKRDKIVALTDVRQKLAEAKDLYSEGESKADEAASVAATAAIGLFNALSEGVINEEEASGVLGDIFGMKGTGDHRKEVFAVGHPNAGKTPAGQGEFIRKRVFRLSRAAEYASGGEPDRFFAVLEPEAVGEVVEEVRSGDRTVWNAYSRLQDMKRDATERTKAAFDPKRIMAIVSDLSDDSAPATVAGSVALRTAYKELISLLLSPAFDEPEQPEGDDNGEGENA